MTTSSKLKGFNLQKYSFYDDNNDVYKAITIITMAYCVTVYPPKPCKCANSDTLVRSQQCPEHICPTPENQPKR